MALGFWRDAINSMMCMTILVYMVTQLVPEKHEVKPKWKSNACFFLPEILFSEKQVFMSLDLNKTQKPNKEWDLDSKQNAK